MAIHENLTKIPKATLRKIGWRKAAEMVKVARHGGECQKAIEIVFAHRDVRIPRPGVLQQVSLLDRIVIEWMGCQVAAPVLAAVA